MPVFTLPQPTTGRWLGLNPWLHPLPIPAYVSLVFPAGNYEIHFDGQEARWRYLGPHFSTIGTREQRGNTLVPVGYKGEVCFAGGWVPGGMPIQPEHLGMRTADMSPDWKAADAKMRAGQQRAYAEMLDALQRNQVGRLLALMIKRRGI